MFFDQPVRAAIPSGKGHGTHETFASVHYAFRMVPKKQSSCPGFSTAHCAYFSSTNASGFPLVGEEAVCPPPRLIQSHPSCSAPVFQEEDMAALWRTLQERGFCCGSPSSPLEGGGCSKAADEGTEPAPRAAPEARRRGGGGVGSSQPSAAKTGAAERAPGGSATNSSSGSRGGDVEGQGGGLRLQRQGLPVGGGVAAPRKTVDIVLHSVAHAPTDAMRQGFLMVRRRFRGGRGGRGRAKGRWCCLFFGSFVCSCACCLSLLSLVLMFCWPFSLVGVARLPGSGESRVDTSFSTCCFHGLKLVMASAYLWTHGSCSSCLW